MDASYRSLSLLVYKNDFSHDTNEQSHAIAVPQNRKRVHDNRPQDSDLRTASMQWRLMG